jgi:ActR/RegA family two-component response regulator
LPTPDKKTKNWKQLAQQAAGEKNPQKLLAIIDELNAALEDRENEIRGKSSRSFSSQTSAAEQIGRSLLFVDDELNIRMTLPPVLQTHGFEVRSAASVAEALAEIKTHKFDLLVSDLNIDQENDGFTVVHAVREANPKCVTILLTGYPAFESAVQAIHDEVDDYVIKPAEIESLVSTMERKLLARRSSS